MTVQVGLCACDICMWLQLPCLTTTNHAGVRVGGHTRCVILSVYYGLSPIASFLFPQAPPVFLHSPTPCHPFSLLGVIDPKP